MTTFKENAHKTAMIAYSSLIDHEIDFEQEVLLNEMKPLYNAAPKLYKALNTAEKLIDDLTQDTLTEESPYLEQFAEIKNALDLASPDNTEINESEPEYKDYHFVTVNVYVLNEQLDDLQEEKEDYPILCSLSDDEKDALLERCCSKDKSIFNCDYTGIDLQQLEELAEYYNFKKPDLTQLAINHGYDFKVHGSVDDFIKENNLIQE